MFLGGGMVAINTRGHMRGGNLRGEDTLQGLTMTNAC